MYTKLDHGVQFPSCPTTDVTFFFFTATLYIKRILKGSSMTSVLLNSVNGEEFFPPHTSGPV